MKLYAAFAKRDDAQRMVFGYASTEALDSHGEIVTRAALHDALPEFMRFANIREMHQPSAVGRAEDASIDDKGLYLAARIVDDGAWEKVKAGVYNGFSIAGRVTARDPMQKHVITGCTLSEISLVDRPANPEAVFDLIKQVERLAKEGRRNSAADQERVQAIHDQACALGAGCPGEAAMGGDPNDDDDSDFSGGDAADDLVAKRLAPVLQRIARSLDVLSRDVAAQNARLKALETAPLPPRGALRALAKGEDLGDPGAAARTPVNTHALIKEALARPRVF
jgi:HK97 family phage prohead protease